LLSGGPSVPGLKGRGRPATRRWAGRPRCSCPTRPRRRAADGHGVGRASRPPRAWCGAVYDAGLLRFLRPSRPLGGTLEPSRPGRPLRTPQQWHWGWFGPQLSSSELLQEW